VRGRRPPRRLHCSACARVARLLRRVAREQPLSGRQAWMVSACEDVTPARARCSRPGVHSKGGCCLDPGSAPGAEAWRRFPSARGLSARGPPYLSLPLTLPYLFHAATTPPRRAPRWRRRSLLSPTMRRRPRSGAARAAARPAPPAPAPPSARSATRPAAGQARPGAPAGASPGRRAAAARAARAAAARRAGARRAGAGARPALRVRHPTARHPVACPARLWLQGCVRSVRLAGHWPATPVTPAREACPGSYLAGPLNHLDRVGHSYAVNILYRPIYSHHL